MTVSLVTALAPLSALQSQAAFHIEPDAIATEALASVIASILTMANWTGIPSVGIRSPRSGTTSFVGLTLPGRAEHRVQLLVGRTVSLQVLTRDAGVHQAVRAHFAAHPGDGTVQTALGSVEGAFRRGDDHYVSGDWSLAQTGRPLSSEHGAIAAAVKTQIALGVLAHVYPRLVALL